MPELARGLGVTRPSPVLSCLGAAALAATLLFTVSSHAGAAEISASELEAYQVAVPEGTAVYSDAEAQSALNFRSTAASRSNVRIENDAALQVEVPELAAVPLEVNLDAEVMTVAVTPAPIWCSFTGLTNIAETDPLCTNPANNTPEQNRSLGQYLAGARGWAGDQWQCLDNLMTRESRWRHNAANSVSSARGIPQKMMSVHYGANWQSSSTAAAWLADPEAQIEWGLDYIGRRYSTPCGAWNFFQRNGWY